MALNPPPRPPGCASFPVPQLEEAFKSSSFAFDNQPFDPTDPGAALPFVKGSSSVVSSVPRLQNPGADKAQMRPPSSLPPAPSSGSWNSWGRARLRANLHLNTGSNIPFNVSSPPSSPPLGAAPPGLVRPAHPGPCSLASRIPDILPSLWESETCRCASWSVAAQRGCFHDLTYSTREGRQLWGKRRDQESRVGCRGPLWRTRLRWSPPR